MWKDLAYLYVFILRQFQEEPSRNVLVSLVIYSTKSVVHVVYVLGISFRSPVTLCSYPIEQRMRQKRSRKRFRKCVFSQRNKVLM